MREEQSLELVLLHGWGCDASIWRPLESALGDAVTVNSVNLDYPQLHYIDAWCDEIATQLTAPTVLCGWSLGGMLATRLAARAPEKIIGLINLATNVSFVADGDWPHAMAKKTFDDFYQLFQQRPQQALKRFALLETHSDAEGRLQHQWLLSLSAKSEETLLSAGLDLLSHLNNRAVLEHVRCPVLHCFGERDALVPVAAAKAMAAVFPHHQVEVLQNSGHLLHYPMGKIDALLLEFINGLSEAFHGY